MKPMYLLAAASALALAHVSVAQADDFSGAYVGGHLGYGFQPDDDDETILFDTDLDGEYGDTVNTTAPANAFSPGFCGGQATGPTPADGCDDDEDGVDYGVRAGYDWQVGPWVFGGLVEASNADVTDAVSGFSTTPARYTMVRELNWIVSARARAGYAFDTLLVYGTAGIAQADVEHSFNTSNGVNTFTERDSDSISGYQFGGGVEMALTPQWRVGAEYLRTSLEDDEYRVRAGGPAPATNPFILVNADGTDFRRSEEDFEVDSFRLTLSYRFGG